METETTPRKGRGPDKRPRKKRKGKSVNPFGRCKNILGHVFGHLRVISKAGPNLGHKRKKSYALWVCQCTCGREVTTDYQSLKRGDRTTCGHKECPYRRIILASNFKSGRDKRARSMARPLSGGFHLTADQVDYILKLPCALCGSKGRAHELRAKDPKKGYTPNGTYNLCQGCAGVVPLGQGNTMPWEEVIQKLDRIITYLNLVGEPCPELKEELKQVEEPAYNLPDGIMCF